MQTNLTTCINSRLAEPLPSSDIEAILIFIILYCNINLRMFKKMSQCLFKALEQVLYVAVSLSRIDTSQ